MGWTFQHRPKGLTDREFFAREFFSHTDTQEILECATVRGAFYAAVRNNPTGRVWALVCLVQRTRGDYNFGYKDMDENMGPGVDEAPARVLDLLSPTEHEYATQWRERCRANLAAKDTRPKVTRGALVRFTHPLNFTDGTSTDTLTFVERSTFTHEGRRFRIPSWRTRAYEVVA